MCGLNSESYLKTFWKTKFVLKAFTSMKVKVTQSCLTLCDPTDCGLPGSSVCILQAGILEWIATSFSRGSSRPRDGTQVSCTAGRFFTTIEAPYFSDPSYIPGCLAFCSHDLIDSGTKLWFICTVFPMLLLLPLSCFSHVRLCATPETCSPPGSPVPGILQARTLEWVAISFSNTWKWKVKGKLLSRVRLLVTPWTAAYQALLSMGFSRQELR